MYSSERLAVALTSLASRVAEPDVRAQLHALSGIVRNLDGRPADPAVRGALEQQIGAAMHRGDEPSAIAAMRRLAALEREPLQPVDWSAASGG